MKGSEENQCIKPQHEGASTNTDTLLSFHILRPSPRLTSSETPLPRWPHLHGILPLSAHGTVSP